MTNTPDIIGIVKGLMNPPEYDVEIHMDWKEEVAEHFPAIAQALLIAVEALEQLTKMPCLTTLLGEDTEGCGCASCTAKLALSRIRSL